MSYTKGAKGENELGGMFKSDFGYEWARVAGSGTADRELPDILVGNDGHLIVFEVKRADNEADYIYLKKREVEDLIFFAEAFGADYYIAYRFDYGDWHFVKKEEMHETEKSYRCERGLSERGLSDICQ